MTDAELDEKVKQCRTAFPAVPTPALRSLVAAGYTHLSHIEGVSDAALLALPGMTAAILEGMRDALRR